MKTLNIKNGTKKTLAEWMEILQIKKVICTCDIFNYNYDAYKSAVKKDRNGFIDIYNAGGNILKHDKLNSCLDKVFYAQNVDIDDIKLVQYI